MSRAARASRTSRAQRAFTMIEMLAVLAIFFLIAAVIVPRIARATDQAVIDEARRLGYSLDFAREKAIALGRTHRVVIDFDTRSYWTEQAPPASGTPPMLRWAELDELPLVAPRDAAGEFARVAGAPGSSTEFGPSTRLSHLEAEGDEIASGLAAIEFAPDGETPPATLWLDNGADLRVEVTIAAFSDPTRVTFHEAE
ncbi:MAG TPA: type II secretion system protein [Myxococcota bacterium]|nr:type II secretion system protein [Myxococcota bacterium]